MPPQKLRFKGILRQPIQRSDARQDELAPIFGGDAYVRNETQRRFIALCDFFRIDPEKPRLYEKIVKAFVEREYGVARGHRDWWHAAAEAMKLRHVPGFRIKDVGAKRSGRRAEWSFQRWAELLADISFEERITEKKIAPICVILTKHKEYKERWGRFKPHTLRKQYLRARALQPTRGYGRPGSTDAIDGVIERHALKFKRKRT